MIIGDVSVVGHQRNKAEEIVAASGLKKGAPFTEESLRRDPDMTRSSSPTRATRTTSPPLAFASPSATAAADSSSVTESAWSGYALIPTLMLKPTFNERFELGLTEEQLLPLLNTSDPPLQAAVLSDSSGPELVCAVVGFVPIGGLLGYLTGTCAAGVFLVMSLGISSRV